MTRELEKAREYEELKEKEIDDSLKPSFHLIPRVGWMNDPNGFSYYKGYYHMFYQYYPYDVNWGPMFWGHAVSKDLLSWENLPAALAPDTKEDSFGCFSGSAIETEDGRHLLMYTGAVKYQLENGKELVTQQQCIAIGDGINYEKYEANPVIKSQELPEGCSIYEFRDPKIWKENGRYYAVMVNKTDDGDGQILKYSSADAINWKYEGVLFKNNKRYGLMLECPDYFAMEGKQVIITSPMDMLSDEKEFQVGNGTLGVIGSLDPQGNFVEEKSQCLDQGIDLYAPQTLELEDGRRVMIGWLQNWDTLSYRGDNFPWYGQLSFPRELSIEEGRLIQKPIREIENYYAGRIEKTNVIINEETSIPGVEGRLVDMTIDIAPVEGAEPYREFQIKFADNGREYSTITYNCEKSTVEINREHAGSRRAILHQRSCKVKCNDGQIRLRLILDRYSAELFINDGQQVMSMVILTDYRAEGISFSARGQAQMNLLMNKLEK